MTEKGRSVLLYDPHNFEHYEYIVSMVDDWNVSTEQWWNDDYRGKQKYSSEKAVPLPLCPPQIPKSLAWDRIRASMVRGRQLTT
jgi:hypothetical protein